MLTNKVGEKSMPDVANTESPSLLGALEWAGMEKIVLPVVLSQGTSVLCQADIFVNLIKEDAKGIHMSRSYMALQKHLEHQRVTGGKIRAALQDFIQGQKGLSTASRILLRWQELHQRKALMSDNRGWKEYPVEVHGELVDGVFRLELKFSFFYSSTCPCSAALASQLYQRAFDQRFGGKTLHFQEIQDWLGEGQIATPHSQRSRAEISLCLQNSVEDLQVLPFIDRLEEDLMTAVQTVVKREDEQEFARLNGENPLFVEDALRVMKNSMKAFPQVESFSIKTHHYESLHAHDAVGMIRS